MTHSKARELAEKGTLTSVPESYGADRQSTAFPLCIDLDGTLVPGDLLFEALVQLIKRNTLYLFLIPFWVFRGRNAFAAEVARRTTLAPEALPYNRGLVDWIGSQRKLGRAIWLCTAWDERLAGSVCAHLGLFDGVLIGGSRSNSAETAVASVLVERFGERGFDYCGRGRHHLGIWRYARNAVLVEAGPSLIREVARSTAITRTFPRRHSRLRVLLRALRPYQWVKNVLVLVPLCAAHRVSDPTVLEKALLASLAFCLCASSVYVLNDILDLEADRKHARKSMRPFASGDLSLGIGFALALVLLAATVLVTRVLSPGFQIAMSIYYTLTVAYSCALKRFVLIDVLILTGLYTLRIIAGTAAAGVPFSFWLLLFSIFLFLSLALVKRFAELDSLRRQRQLKAVGRGYETEDLSVLQSLGSSAGYSSVLVLALYINSPDIAVLYRRPQLIWLLCMLMLYWVSHVWMAAQRGLMHDDPLVFALKDRMSQATGLLASVTILIAT
jgi:4-hydroxybenzoate polyprenyltransferase